eukprot:2085295-Prymnesium_polylepis.1
MRVNVDCDEMSLESPLVAWQLRFVEVRAESQPTPVQRGVQRGSHTPSPGSCASLEPEPEDCTDG